jgi:hypothetical protein
MPPVRSKKVEFRTDSRRPVLSALQFEHPRFTPQQAMARGVHRQEISAIITGAISTWRMACVPDLKEMIP